MRMGTPVRTLAIWHSWHFVSSIDRKFSDIRGRDEDERDDGVLKTVPLAANNKRTKRHVVERMFRIEPTSP